MTGDDTGFVVGHSNGAVPEGTPAGIPTDAANTASSTPPISRRIDRPRAQPDVDNRAVASPATSPHERDSATATARTDQNHASRAATEDAAMTTRGGSSDSLLHSRRIGTRARDTDATDRGGKVVAWAGFVSGSVLSILMNWLHTWLPAKENPGWTPDIWPQIGSAVWPVFLLLSVETLARVRWQQGLLWALARYGGIGTVAAGAAVISYGHVRAVLESWGYGSVGSGVGPLVLDGLMVLSGFALLSEAGSAKTTRAEQVPPTAAQVPVTASDTVAGTSTDACASTNADGEPIDTESPVAYADATGTTARDGHATASDSNDATDRDARILELHRFGLKTRDIALVVGVHHSTVARVVARHNDKDDECDTATPARLTDVSANGQGTTP